ncbi:MAG: hypothetical protein AMXMBFR37_26950 [Steroidobacteraceae bacterium]
MSAFGTRRDEDMAKLRALDSHSGGRIKVTRVMGNPTSQIGLRLLVRTAEDESFPVRVLTEVNATIHLGSRYPFEEPRIELNTKVFNPNIYSSGRVCLGSKWIATEYLDLLVQRLFKILAFDDGIINTASAANGEAARWYARAKGKYPNDFPSDTLIVTTAQQKSSVKWADRSSIQSSAERVIVNCPMCNMKLRVPTGRTGTVSCPSCKNAFRVTS